MYACVFVSKYHLIIDEMKKKKKKREGQGGSQCAAHSVPVPEVLLVKYYITGEGGTPLHLLRRKNQELK
jgi:hypothetical protein